MSGNQLSQLMQHSGIAEAAGFCRAALQGLCMLGMRYHSTMKAFGGVALLSVSFVNIAKAEPATEADRAAVIAWAKQALADPQDLRSTEISDRAKVKGVLVLCVAFKAKNQAGSYEGLVRKAFEIKLSGLVHDERSYRVNAATCYAPEINWRPFPELAAIRLQN